MIVIGSPNCTLDRFFYASAAAPALPGTNSDTLKQTPSLTRPVINIPSKVHRLQQGG